MRVAFFLQYNTFNEAIRIKTSQEQMFSET